jgi:hypothetical protein
MAASNADPIQVWTHFSVQASPLECRASRPTPSSKYSTFHSRSPTRVLATSENGRSEVSGWARSGQACLAYSAPPPCGVLCRFRNCAPHTMLSPSEQSERAVRRTTGGNRRRPNQSTSSGESPRAYRKRSLTSYKLNKNKMESSIAKSQKSKHVYGKSTPHMKSRKDFHNAKYQKYKGNVEQGTDWSLYFVIVTTHIVKAWCPTLETYYRWNVYNFVISIVGLNATGCCIRMLRMKVSKILLSLLLFTW